MSLVKTSLENLVSATAGILTSFLLISSTESIFNWSGPARSVSPPPAGVSLVWLLLSFLLTAVLARYQFKKWYQKQMARGERIALIFVIAFAGLFITTFLGLFVEMLYPEPQTVKSVAEIGSTFYSLKRVAEVSIFYLSLLVTVLFSQFFVKP